MRSRERPETRDSGMAGYPVLGDTKSGSQPGLGQNEKSPALASRAFKNTGSKGRSRTADPSIMSAVLKPTELPCHFDRGVPQTRRVFSVFRLVVSRLFAKKNVRFGVLPVAPLTLSTPKLAYRGVDPR